MEETWSVLLSHGDISFLSQLHTVSLHRAILTLSDWWLCTFRNILLLFLQCWCIVMQSESVFSQRQSQLNSTRQKLCCLFQHFNCFRLFNNFQMSISNKDSSSNKLQALKLTCRWANPANDYVKLIIASAT